jgi:microcystin-dependent protein
MSDVPVGAILPFYGRKNQVPKGYLLCDGSSFTRKEWPVLYELLVKANHDLCVDLDAAVLPNLQGYFLRGLNEGSGLDGGRSLGSQQADELKRHSHKVPGEVQFHRPPAGGAFTSVPNEKVDNNVKDPETTEVGGAETRPTNIALNFIIRAQP